MAGKPAAFPDGIRVTDLMGMMVLAECFPLATVNEVLTLTGKGSQRERNLPAPLMVYYLMALGLYRQFPYQEVLRSLFESFRWLSPEGADFPISSKAAVSQARARLGPEPLQLLYESKVGPVADRDTTDAFFHEWRLVTLDGTTLDLGDTTANEEAFGRPAAGRGKSAFPQLRMVTLIENGTHILFGAVPGPCSVAEVVLAQKVLLQLTPGMLCLADRLFYGFELWSRAASTGADLVWRVKKNLLLPCEERLGDGSYLSTVYPTAKDRKQKSGGRRVRVVEYRLRDQEGVGPATSAGKDSSPGDDDMIYRLITTILDDSEATALELAALYARRWEVETTLDEFKTHLHGHDLVLRSKTPAGVYQEFWGLLLAHHVVRYIMYQSAQRNDISPHRLSYTHSLREIRRKLPQFLVIPPSVPSGTLSTSA